MPLLPSRTNASPTSNGAWELLGKMARGPSSAKVGSHSKRIIDSNRLVHQIGRRKKQKPYAAARVANSDTQTTSVAGSPSQEKEEPSDAAH